MGGRHTLKLQIDLNHLVDCAVESEKKINWG